MRTSTLVPAALLALTLAGCQQQAEEAQPAPPEASKEALTTQQLDDQIWAGLRKDGRYDWSQASDHTIWSALTRSDFVLSVGYQPASQPRGCTPPADAGQATDWQAARQQVLQIILEEERKANPKLTLNGLLVFEENVLPVLDVQVHELSTVQRLRRSGLVRYAEPMGYEPYHAVANKGAAALSSSGCGNNTATAGLVAGDDYTILNNGSKSSWNQADQYHGIRAGWSQSTGQGMKLVVIDTGCSDAQENLGSAFNQGLSSGRTVERLVTLPRNSIFGIPYGDYETPNDGCGHGTSMAGAAAGPRGTDGAAVGIAYNANLLTVRAAEDVFIDASREVKGVADAYVLAGNRTDVRVISMSMGRLTSSSQITDAIRYAYGRGKLIFCAAGTSLDWTAGLVGVIYPASLPEAVAVTGMKSDLSTRCDECHVGADVEFTVVMQPTSNNLRPLTLAMSGDAPSTVGGSSVATASMAGMAAVVWAKYPTETRAQIMARLVAASSNRNARSSSFGWGRVNVAAAVGALPL
ncbi:Serine protease, subtilisin family [Hymenobacter daecheongensis DSM 21074]|uniref:Serine protease, subtilisin family n=1 Tax=Hymenobacter daecheongensis DSM 21074 TaxID=1121955 RepID=A0A1M6JSD6_9BACT|nr:S8/S53 family peptidase [Hymenobacter daecheongensis]SHJ49569.1 Serine protease, subtilisin family [Hymenobacter daecheongensis DSM 21074]